MRTVWKDVEEVVEYARLTPSTYWQLRLPVLLGTIRWRRAFATTGTDRLVLKLQKHAETDLAFWTFLRGGDCGVTRSTLAVFARQATWPCRRVKIALKCMLKGNMLAQWCPFFVRDCAWRFDASAPTNSKPGPLLKHVMLNRGFGKEFWFNRPHIPKFWKNISQFRNQHQTVSRNQEVQCPSSKTKRPLIS